MINNQKKCLKGAVLISVLMIMTIVVILTMSALTIALAMHQRTMNKYEDNQAYFSARSALNSTLACIQNYTGTEDDQYVILAKQVTKLAGGHTGDYFTATVSVERPPAKASGLQDPVEMRFENIDEVSNLVKITAVSNIGTNGYSSVSVVFSVGDYVPPSTFSNALTTLGAASGVNISAYGGSALNLKRKTTSEIELTNDGKIVGPVTVNGSAKTATQTVYAITKSEGFVCMINDGNSSELANLSINNPTAFCGYDSSMADSKERPHVYVSGNINISSNALFGYKSAPNGGPLPELSDPVDVYCNTITGSNGLQINGDLYIHGSPDDITRMFHPEDNFQPSFNFNSINISGNIYFDNAASAAIFQSEMVSKIDNNSVSSVVVGGLNIESSMIPVSSTPTELTNDKKLETILNPFKAMDGFTQKNDDGTTIFDADGTPALAPTKAAPGSSSSLNDFWDASQNAYVINTGASDLVNIDLSLSAGWGGNTYIERPVVVSGTGKCNFYLPAGKTCYLQNNGACILTKELYDLYSKSSRTFSSLKFESGDGSIKAPNINLYLGDGSTFQENNNTVVSAYIYGPNATFGGMGVSCSDLTYDNENCGSVQGISAIGAVICGNMASGGNRFLAVYVPQGGSGDDEEKAADGSNLSFQYYSR